tara:strand:+ start:232 stop:783 length:552 start_codon:yes stop_codon:yes gene_type:complete
MPTLNPNLTVAVNDSLSSSTGLNNLNFLQPTAFQMTIDRQHFTNLQFFCQTVLHPSLNVNAIEVPFKRVSTVPFAGDKLTFTELTCIIIVDENMNSYTEMYNWMQRSVLQPDVGPTKRDTTKPPTYCDMTLQILSSHNNKNRSIKYKDCLPTSLGDMTLESTSGDNQYITFPATFRFTTFELR